MAFTAVLLQRGTPLTIRELPGAFLLGGFFSAYMKVNHHSSSAVENAVHMLEPVRKHLSDSGCIGSISEIFDGDTPHNPRGCYAQAWSVGEVLRCYCEDILPYL